MTKQEDRKTSLPDTRADAGNQQPDETGRSGFNLKIPVRERMRRISGFRFRASSGEYMLQRGRTEQADTASEGGGRRILFRTFVIFVLFPSLLALFYYAFIASNVYVSEAKLTVRAAVTTDGKSAAPTNSASALIGKLGLGKSGPTAQDTRIVLEYVKSRMAMEDAGGRAVLAQYYAKPEIDWISRLDSDDYSEELFSYWQSQVTASVDTVSNILTLRVRAYTPEDALSLAEKIVSSSEALINNISRRSREDALAQAEEEVSRSMSELAEARHQLLSFQQSAQSIDPVKNAKQITTLISTLTLKKIEIESQLSVSQTTGMGVRPGDRHLQTQLDVINKQIDELRNMLTGKDKTSVSMQLKDFELLSLRQEFAEQIYILSRANYEEARREVAKKQLYLVVVVPPLKPEYALFPHTLLDTALVFLGCLVLWAIATLVGASIKDSLEW